MSFLRSAHDLSKIIRLKLAQYTNVYYLCRVKLKHIITMSNETDYLISLLMQNKAKKKMLDFVFENNIDADEKKMNAILDEKLRVEKNIENIEKALKELEK